MPSFVQDVLRGCMDIGEHIVRLYRLKFYPRVAFVLALRAKQKLPFCLQNPPPMHSARPGGCFITLWQSYPDIVRYSSKFMDVQHDTGNKSYSAISKSFSTATNISIWFVKYGLSSHKRLDCVTMPAQSSPCAYFRLNLISAVSC